VESYFLSRSLNISNSLSFALILEFSINFAQYLLFSVATGVFYLASGIVRLPKSQAHAWMQAITGEHFAQQSGLSSINLGWQSVFELLLD